MYSRIDYIFISHCQLDFLTSTGIEYILWVLGHVPIWSRIQFSPENLSPISWKINDNLLNDLVSLSDVKQTISNFLSDHESDHMP